MERLDPRLTFGRKASFYATSEAHTDLESLDAMAQLALASPDDLVLDVATGAGHAGARLLAEGARVVGLDITRPMLAEARRLYGGEGLSVVQGDVSMLPFPRGVFDIVLSRRAPHHFPYLDEGLASMRDALRPGGAMVIDDRSVPEDDFVDRTMNHLDRLHDRSHVRQLRPSAWRDALDRCGLVLERLYTYHRRRPLSSLTQTAMEEDAREIERIVRALDAGDRERMGIEVSGDSITVTHWFVLLRASRP